MLNNIALALVIVNTIGVIVLWKRDKSLLYAMFAISLVILFGITTFKDLTPEWKDIQRGYVRLLAEKVTDPVQIEKLNKYPIKIRQAWNHELGVTDRCQTCHLGVDNPQMKGAPQPYTFHPVAHVLEDGRIVHDFNTIGCTICHEGQGRATTKDDAHARGIRHWETPMYPSGKKGMAQASCAKCHEELTKPEGYEILVGADMIMDARDFTLGQNDLEIQCTSCHSIYGVGEVVAPDLSAFGESTEHEFEATHIMNFVEGKKDKYNWAFQHFLDPQKITPDDEKLGIEETIMPNFEMSEEMAHKLTTLVYSMKESAVPVKFRYRPEIKKREAKRGRIQKEIAGLYTPEEYEKLSEGEKLFLKYPCWVCHSINGKGGKLAPDLTKVGKRRNEAWMIKHFKDPPAITKKSFMPKFNLSDEQIEELITYLKTLQ